MPSHPASPGLVDHPSQHPSDHQFKPDRRQAPASPRHLALIRVPVKASALALALAATLLWSSAATALVAPESVDGQVESRLDAGRLAITASDNAILRWERLVVESDTVLDIALPGPSSRVLIDVGASVAIAGRLTSNGHVHLVGRHGVQIDRGAVVRVAHLTVSTVPIAAEPFAAGRAIEFSPREARDASIAHSGTIESRAPAGGRVALLSHLISVGDEGRIDASADLGGGAVTIGGGFTGEDRQLPAADRVHIARGARIAADARRDGNGGDVVVWSERSTTFLGGISAAGAGRNGRAGRAEVSSRGSLVFDGRAALHSADGTAGQLLIDPVSITIQASNPDIDGLGQGHDIATGSDLADSSAFPGVNSIITAGALQALLTGGVTLTLAATTSITVNAAVTAPGAVTGLVLDAPTVNLNQRISLPFGGSISGTATVVNVGPGGQIQNGVDAVAPGGTVNLAAATYVQEVAIRKSLTLSGSGAATTSIVCPSSPSPLNNTFVYTVNGATYHPCILAEGADAITIQNLTVDGNSQSSNFQSFRFVGIGYHNAGGTIQSVTAIRIEDGHPGGPTQHGLAIFGAIDDGLPHTIQVLGNQVEQFQKQGITMRGSTLTAVIADNTVTGETPPSQANANGIVLQDNATATISNNSVSNFISVTPANDAVGILLFNGGAGIHVADNAVSESNIGIFSINAAPDLVVSGNVVTDNTHEAIHVEEPHGQTTLTANQMACGPLSVSPATNMDLVSTANRPFALADNAFTGCDLGLIVQGGGQTGPMVAMSHDQFVGTTTDYIQLITAPNDIWPTTATASFDGLVSGQITQAQFDQLLTKIVDKHNDPALGLVLDFIPPTPTVSIAKTSADTVATPTGAVAYTVTAANAGVIAADGAVVADPIPAGLTAFSWTCATTGGAVCHAAAGTGDIAATISAFPAGAAVTYAITATVAAAAPAVVVNAATITPPAGGICSGPCTAMATIPGGASVSVSSSSTGSAPLPGGSTTFTVTVVNTGSVAAGGTALSDPLPPGVTAFNWTCVAANGAVCPAPSGTGPIAAVIATLPPGGSVTFAIAASVGDAPPEVLVNTATIAPPAGGVCDANQCTATAPAPVTALIAIAKSATPGSAQPGGTAAYTLTVSNRGPRAAGGTAISDPLPSGIAAFSWTCAATGGTACPAASGSGAIETTVAVFPAGGVLTFSIAATLDAAPPATVTNTATLAPPANFACVGPCSASASTPVAAQVAIAKSTSTDSAQPGDTVVYTVTATNRGPRPADGTVISDPLPQGLKTFEWTCAATGGTACPAAAGTGAIEATVAAFPSGGAVTFTITARVDTKPPTTITNSAMIAPPGGVACAGSCSASASVASRAPTAVPALSPAMLILLAGLILAVGWRRQRAIGS